MEPGTQRRTISAPCCSAESSVDPPRKSLERGRPHILSWEHHPPPFQHPPPPPFRRWCVRRRCLGDSRLGYLFRSYCKACCRWARWIAHTTGAVRGAVRRKQARILTQISSRCTQMHADAACRYSRPAQPRRTVQASCRSSRPVHLRVLRASAAYLRWILACFPAGAQRRWSDGPGGGGEPVPRDQTVGRSRRRLHHSCPR